MAVRRAGLEDLGVQCPAMVPRVFTFGPEAVVLFAISIPLSVCFPSMTGSATADHETDVVLRCVQMPVRSSVSA